MRKKGRLGALLLLTALLLSACSPMEFGTENLMETPRLTEQQEEIREALSATLGTEDFRLYTPKSGDNRSAVVYADLCGDSSFEAVVLYRLNAVPQETRVTVLTRGTSTAWEGVCDFAPAEGSTVERVETAKLLPTGYRQMIFGTTLYTGRERALSVWELDTGKPVCTFNSSYSEMVVGDLDEDESGEMVLFNSLPEGGTSVALVDYAIETGLDVQATELLDVQFTTYLQVMIGNTDTGSRAVFVDGRTGTDTYATEVVSVRSGQPVKLFGAECPTRTVPVVSRDADADGSPEIPVQEILPGYADVVASEKVVRIDWCSCGAAGLTVRWVSAVNSKWSYLLRLPDRLVGSVTVLSDDSDNAWTLCMWDADKQATAQKVLTVRSWIASQWEEEEALHPEQTVFMSRGNVCYTVEFYRDDLITREELGASVMILL